MAWVCLETIRSTWESSPKCLSVRLFVHAVLICCSSIYVMASEVASMIAPHRTVQGALLTKQIPSITPARPGNRSLETETVVWDQWITKLVA